LHHNLPKRRLVLSSWIFAHGPCRSASTCTSIRRRRRLRRKDPRARVTDPA
jgi:hypothetical protein